MLILSDKRSPNSMENISDFLARWHSIKKGFDLPKAYTRSPFGRINFHGADDCTYAFPYARFDSHFTDALEPFVRPLVECLVDNNFITYTSCEGHSFVNHFLELHVGVISHTGAGAYLIQQVVAQTNRALQLESMRVHFQLYAGELYCETQCRAVPCLDIYLEKKESVSTAHYMAARKSAVSQLLELFRNTSCQTSI